MEKKHFNKIIDEICEEKNINQKKMSFGWIRDLEKDGKKSSIIHYQFDLNKSNPMLIVNDKYATYELLSSYNIPTIEHRMIFSPKTRKDFYDVNYKEIINQVLNNNNNKIVIKANDSCQGKDVYYASNLERAEKIVEKIFSEDNDSLSVCPYLDIVYEYRNIYLDGEIIYTYKKRKPYVIGDGIHTVGELIEEKFKDVDITICSTVNQEEVLEQGIEKIVSWKHNLSNGAEPILINEDNDEYLKDVQNIAIKTGNALDVRFVSIDIALTKSKKILVMEVNGSVCMNKFIDLIDDGYEIAKSIYTKAIDKMF